MKMTMRWFGDDDPVRLDQIRQVPGVTGNRTFHESPHPSRYGSIDMYRVMNALVRAGFDGPIRPDHGRMIWGEQDRPGYGLFDRALGVMYLSGLEEAARHQLDTRLPAPVHV